MERGSPRFLVMLGLARVIFSGQSRVWIRILATFTISRSERTACLQRQSQRRHSLFRSYTSLRTLPRTRLGSPVFLSHRTAIRANGLAPGDPERRGRASRRALVTKMGRIRPQIVAGKLGFRALESILPGDWHIANEDLIVVSDWGKPEPDLTIVRGQARDYLDRNVMAADLALVVETAESTLSAD